ncbi:WD repeat-containing protein 38, partial [Ceratobasidium sp. 370]
MPPNPPQPDGLRRSLSRVSSRVGLRLKETFASSPPSRSNSRSRSDVQPKLSALRQVLSESNFDQPLPSITPNAEVIGFDFISRTELWDSRDDLSRAPVLPPASKGPVLRFEAPRPARSQSPVPFTSLLSTDSVPDLHSVQIPIPQVVENPVVVTPEPERAVEIPTVITPEPQRPDPSPPSPVQTLVQATDDVFNAEPGAQDPGALEADLDAMPTPVAHIPEISTTTTPEPQRPVPTPSPTIQALVLAAGHAFSESPLTRAQSPMPGTFTPSPTGSVLDLASTRVPVPLAGEYPAPVAPKPRRGVAPPTVQALVRATSGAAGAMPSQGPISRETSPAPTISVQSPGSPMPFPSIPGTGTTTPDLLTPHRFLRPRSSQSGLQSSLYPRSSSPSFNCSSSTEGFASDSSLGTVHPGTISHTSLESGPSNHYGNRSKLSSLDTSGGIASTDTSRPASASSSPGRRSNNRFKETAWGALVAGLKTLDKCTSGCSTVNEVIKAMVVCVDAVQESERHRKEYDELARNLSEMTDRLTEHHERVGLAKVSDCTINLMSSLQAEIDYVAKKQKRSASSRITGAMGDREDLVDCYRRIEMIFSRLTNDATLGAWSITNEHLANTRLDGLAPAKQAWYDCSGIRRHACTPNTRQQILTELKKWANDTNSPKVFWLNGMAGTGKTTIAYSFCSELESSRQLGASFFCCRTLPECRDMGRIIPTIAYQLARSSLPFQHALCEALGVSPDMGARGISLQFEKLLRDPLLKVEKALPPVLVVVIDALDECAGHDGAQPVLDALIHHTRDLPVKFFVT